MPRVREGGGVKRKLFTFCSALSLLLCTATCVLWAATSRVGRGIAFHNFPGKQQSGQMPPAVSGEIVSAWGSLAYVRIVIEYDDTFPRGPMRYGAIRLDRDRPRSYF